MLITIAPCPEKKNHHIWYEYSLHNYFPLEGNMIHLKINFNFLNLGNKYTKLESCCSVTKRFSKIKGTVTPLFCIYLPLISHQYVAFHLNKFNSPFHKDALICHWVLLKLWRSWKCQNFIEKFIETQFRHHAWAWSEFGSCTLKTNLKKQCTCWSAAI